MAGRGRPSKKVIAQTQEASTIIKSDETGATNINAIDLLKDPVIVTDDLTEEQKEQALNAFDNIETNSVYIKHIQHGSKPSEEQYALIEQKYQYACATPSDINELLPYLRAASDVCAHITEFGVRSPTSTWAFLAGNPERLISYDIVRDTGIDEVESIAPNFTFILGNTLEVEIEETDFLFIDTFHTAEQLSQELALHAHKVRKYIGMHDVFTFGEIGEAEYSSGLQYGNKPGLRYAIEPFLQVNQDWTVDFHTTVNNGLLILRRLK